jgi:multidrug efflux pump subunit AcrA (membrane-fusion protein)
VPNTGGRLKPGLSADVSVTLAERPHSITIPDEAVFAEGSSNLVFVVKPDSTVTRVPLGFDYRQMILVDPSLASHGMKPGAAEAYSPDEFIIKILIAHSFQHFEIDGHPVFINDKFYLHISFCNSFGQIV